MKLQLTIGFLFFNILTAICQNDKLVEDKNIPSLFQVSLDSIEQIIDDSDVYRLTCLCYSVKNISNDTLTFITNSCPSYNQYILSIGDTSFVVNRNIYCSFNMQTKHQLAPNEVFQNCETVQSEYLERILIDSINHSFQIPLHELEKNQYVVGNGYDHYKQIVLSSSGTCKIVKRKIDVTKRKNKKRSKLSSNLN